MNKFNLGKVRGEAGKSATIAIGTVRTGQEGSDASVDNAGDSLRAIFDFTIPRGDKGEKGDRGNEAYSAGSNVQISGGVISATDTTYAPATPYADGLMSKEDKVRLDGVLVDLDSKVDDDDPRLTDSREWSEATVTQAEAEAGTASTRRAWTAQRVRQAINAWWQLVTSGFGRNFIAASNEQAARNVLQLGTAATRNAVVSNADTTAGRVVTPGWMGIGGPAVPATQISSDWDDIVVGGLYLGSGMSNSPFGSEWAYVICLEHLVNTYVAQVAYSLDSPNPKSASRRRLNGVWSPWREVCTTGNILATTGQSTQFPMTQKAVTDAINGISDERDKTDVDEIDLGLEVIENLKTFSFKLNNRDWYRQEAAKELIEVEEDGKIAVREKINDEILRSPLSDFEENDGSLKRDDVYTGFVAQDLKEALEELGLDHLGIVKNYADEYEGGEDRFYIEHLALLPFLVNSIKQLSARVKALEGRQVE